MGRRLVVFFPKTGEKLTLAADDSALKPLPPGARAIPEDPLERLKALDPDREQTADRTGAHPEDRRAIGAKMARHQHNRRQQGQ